MAEGPSGINPAISLGVTGGGHADNSPGNALGMVTSIADIQNKLNSAKLFQQQFQAKQIAGSIMASAPNEEEGLKRIMMSPAGPFMGEVVNQYRQSMLAMTQIAGSKMEQNDKAMGLAIKGLAGAIHNPSQLGGIKQQVMSMMPPDIAERVGPAVDGLYAGVTAGLPSDPSKWSPAHQQKFASNVGGMLMRGNMSGSDVRQLEGAIEPGVREITTSTGQKQLVPVGQAATGEPVTGGAGAGPNALTGSGAPQTQAGGSALSAPYGQTTQQQKLDESRAADIADQWKGLDSTVQIAGRMQQVITEARKAMKEFTPGPGSTINLGIANFYRALGGKQEIADQISGGNTGAMTEFQKLVVQTTMGQVQQQMPPGSRLNRDEFNIFNSRNPNLDTDPRAVEKIFNFWTRQYQMLHAEQMWLGDFVKKGGNPSDWPRMWQEEAQRRGYISPHEVPTDFDPKKSATSYRTTDDLKRAVEKGHLSREEALAVGIEKGIIKDDRTAPRKGPQ